MTASGPPSSPFAPHTTAFRFFSRASRTHTPSDPAAATPSTADTTTATDDALPATSPHAGSAASPADARPYAAAVENSTSTRFNRCGYVSVNFSLRGTLGSVDTGMLRLTRTWEGETGGREAVKDGPL